LSAVVVKQPAPDALPGDLAASQAFCAQVTRRAAKNFYYGLRLLPESRRSAMFALYAYMRAIDDIADDGARQSLEQRQAQLDVWQAQTHAAIAGDSRLLDGELWPSFADTVRRYHIPQVLFDEAIAGQRQDLRPVAFETFEELRQYCYRVAGVVGLASIHIWGFDGAPATEALAIDRGLAFQLTNILRDLREDLERGRVYLPRAELAAAGISAADLAHGCDRSRFEEFMRLQIGRAEDFYRSSADLENHIELSSRPTLIAMTDIYHGILSKIARCPRRVLTQRISLSLASKLRIMWRAMRS